MRESFAFLLVLCLTATSVAQAQPPGGGGRGQRGGGGGSPASPRATPVDKVDVVGVVRQIGPEPDRLTIAYEAVEGLNWPAGMKPFVVEKVDLLKGVTVGEKVRFRLESQQIASLAPF